MPLWCKPRKLLPEAKIVGFEYIIDSLLSRYNQTKFYCSHHIGYPLIDVQKYSGEANESK